VGAALAQTEEDERGGGELAVRRDHQLLVRLALEALLLQHVEKLAVERGAGGREQGVLRLLVEVLLEDGDRHQADLRRDRGGGSEFDVHARDSFPGCFPAMGPGSTTRRRWGNTFPGSV